MEDRSGGIRTGDAVACVAAFGLLLAACVLGPVGARVGGSWQTVAVQATLVVCGCVGAAALWRRTGTWTLVAIVAVALAARALLAPWPPLQSNDVYRYLWDGRLLAHGIDPYVVPPSASSLAAFRADAWLYARIDWRNVPTLYPPIDLAIYALGAWLGALARGGIVPLKVLLLAGDVATIALVAAELRALGLPLGRLALYAWSPLAIVEFGLNGHEESVAIAFLVATVAALRARAPLVAGAALAAAILSKLYPAALVPALFARRRLLPSTLVVVTLVVAAYAPFVVWNRDVLGFLHAFAFGYHFNDSLHRVVGTFGAAAIFACAIVIAAIERTRGVGAVAIVLGLEIAYLLVSPNVYPWYLAVFVALLPLMPDAFVMPMRPLGLALVAWTALAPLAYLSPWWTPVGSPLDVAAHAIEYAPLVLAACVYAIRERRRVAALLGLAAFSGCASHAAAATPIAPVAMPAAREAAPARASADVAHGAAFYAANCAVCHTPTRASFIGPDLTHVAARRSRASLRAHIATSVPNGTTFPPATVDALVAYLERLNAPLSERSTTK